MPDRATLFDVRPAPMLCGERGRVSHVWHFRLSAAAFQAEPEAVAFAIRKTDMSTTSGRRTGGILLSADEPAIGANGAEGILRQAAAVAVALKASIPTDVEAPPAVTAEMFEAFWTDDRWSNVGVVIPLDAASPWIADDPIRWGVLRECLRVPSRGDDYPTASRSIIARIRLGLISDLAVLDAIRDLEREDHVTTIAIALSAETRSVHIERVAHAVDTMWSMNLTPSDIPCDSIGAILSPQDVDRAAVDTLRKSYPIDVGSADASMLARVPGVGRAAYKVVAARNAGELNYAGDFVACGVDLFLARPFLRHHAL
jgi:hypothetical protein